MVSASLVFRKRVFLLLIIFFFCQTLVLECSRRSPVRCVGGDFGQLMPEESRVCALVRLRHYSDDDDVDDAGAAHQDFLGGTLVENGQQDFWATTSTLKNRFLSAQFSTQRPSWNEEQQSTTNTLLMSLSNMSDDSQSSWTLPHQHTSMEPPLCAGCSFRITDKFYLSAVEAKWHSACLKCSECGVELENQLSCFERDNQIFCKEDYSRIYGGRPTLTGNRQCSRCLCPIRPTDLVMRARQHLFHVDCFRCAVCNCTFIKGDLFGMYDAVVYCQLHFRQEQRQQMLHNDEPSGYQQLDAWPHFGTGPDLVNNNEPIISNGGKKKRGRRKHDDMEEESARRSSPHGFLEAANGCYPMGDHGGSSKTKRARTSFKHHQLRIMKGHFQVNQNPDSRELKMLAQKTGLDKKVLQVWFQNARAKWRRVNNAQGNPPLVVNHTSTSSSSSDGCNFNINNEADLKGGKDEDDDEAFTFGHHPV